MNDALKMQISAFVDGELPDNESELLLRRLSQDAALRQQVAEYLGIGRLIRRDAEVPGMDQLRGRIAAALGDEPAVSAPESPRDLGASLMTPASGVAVAATVAAVALIGFSQLNAPVEPVIGNDAVAIDMAPVYTEPSIDQVLQNQPSDLLLDYRRRHGESSPELGSGDILYRMADFQINPGLEEIEPDGHLASDDEAAGSDQPTADGASNP
jgi:negative regulator of sigma E activity